MCLRLQPLALVLVVLVLAAAALVTYRLSGQGPEGVPRARPAPPRGPQADERRYGR